MSGKPQGHKRDITGQRYHSLVAVEAVFVGGIPLWRCKCDCGGEWTGPLYRLTGSRGLPGMACRECRNRKAIAVSTKHGSCTGGVSSLWSIWSGMKDRCSRPSNHAFAYYGGKGVRVHAEWSDFSPFKAWAEANGYLPGLSIERKNAALGYSPDNCEWITRSENSRRANIGREYRGGKRGGMRILARAAAAFLTGVAGPHMAVAT